MTRSVITTIASAAALLIATYGAAATITVPAGGDLQAALDRAQPGDTVLLQPGATYTGNYVLGDKAAGGF
ncbi:MAG: hypothetical protein ACM3NQ_12305, partial [Bacteroidales bacterium]